MNLLGNLGTLLRQSIAGVLLRSVLIATFYIVVGMTLPDFIARFLENPPGWLTTWWFRLLLTIGLTAIVGGGLYLTFGVVRVSKRQAAVDSLARDISEAIHDLLNRHTRETITPQFIDQWEKDYREWCDKVSKKLSNRRFFTESDQLHFDRLGVVPQLGMTGHAKLDWLIAQLQLKFDRLRQIIQSVPLRHF